MKRERINHRHLMDFDIAGFTYWDGAMVLSELKPGMLLDLEREEANRFDPYAVAIYYGEYKLGFVPRDSNRELSKYLEMGYEDLYEVRINRVTPEAHTEHQVGVIIHLKQNNTVID